MKSIKIKCLLWVSDAECFITVPRSVINQLRKKGAHVVETSEVLGIALTVRFFQIQTGKVAA